MTHLNDGLMIARRDFDRLSTLAENAEPTIAAFLEQELNRAEILPDEQVPHDVVTMNSMVKFLDLDSQKEIVATLVYPHEAKIEENRISVLAPVGAALIGLRVGQSIQWPMPNGKKRKLQVMKVLKQPESKQ